MHVSFLNANANGKMVDSYEIRYRIGTFATDADFASGDPAPLVTPGAPDAPATLEVDYLKPGRTYTLGVRSFDGCSQHSDVAAVSFETTAQKFTQLSGCFVATAAYGSALEPQVAALRRGRDRLRTASPLFATAADLYYRSGPAAAAVVATSAVARGLARRVIGPFAGLAEALDAAAAPGRPLGAPLRPTTIVTPSDHRIASAQLGVDIRVTLPIIQPLRRRGVPRCRLFPTEVSPECRRSISS